MHSRVLIVEDDAMLRNVLALALARDGLVCKAAPDGEAGLELIRREHYDLVLTDMRMPRMSGLQMILASRESCPPGKPRFLLLSGYHDHSADELAAAGVAEVLHKPVSLQVLRARVQALLRPY